MYVCESDVRAIQAHIQSIHVKSLIVKRHIGRKRNLRSAPFPESQTAQAYIVFVLGYQWNADVGPKVSDCHMREIHHLHRLYRSIQPVIFYGGFTYQHRIDAQLYLLFLLVILRL